MVGKNSITWNPPLWASSANADGCNTIVYFCNSSWPHSIYTNLRFIQILHSGWTVSPACKIINHARSQYTDRQPRRSPWIALILTTTERWTSKNSRNSIGYFQLSFIQPFAFRCPNARVRAWTIRINPWCLMCARVHLEKCNTYANEPIITCKLANSEYTHIQRSIWCIS